MKQISATSGPTNIGLLSVGSYRPERVVTNDELCENIDSSDEWIYSRTGIKTRRFAARDESAASMATEAGREAIAKASLEASDIDCVIVATSTHLLQTPRAPRGRGGAGRHRRARLRHLGGLRRVRVRAGRRGRHDPRRDRRQGAGPGLGEAVPTIDMQDRSNCFIFADGAAGVVVGETPTQGIGPTVWGSDGNQASAIRQDIDWLDYLENPTGPRPFLRLEGSAVFRWAAFEMGKVGQQAMDAAGIRPDEIDVFVPHQANSRINEILAKSLELRPDAVIANDIEHTGNTSAASIPLAMAEVLATGAAKAGDLALLIGYGAGLSYAAQVVRLPNG